MWTGEQLLILLGILFSSDVLMGLKVNMDGQCVPFLEIKEWIPKSFAIREFINVYCFTTCKTEIKTSSDD